MEPRWAHGGDEVFCESTDRSFSKAGYVRGGGVPLYEVAANRDRFLMVTRLAPHGRAEGDGVS